VSLRIAFDLDGVLADMDGALAREAEAVFGKGTLRAMRGRRAGESAKAAPSPSDEQRTEDASATNGQDNPIPTPVASDVVPSLMKLRMSPRQQQRLWRHIETVENFWETLSEIEDGSIARLAAIATERRWEIIFLTRRPRTAGATAQLQSQRWLDAKGFSFPSVYVGQGSRGRIIDALGVDVAVDDTPDNCLDILVESKARAILVWRDDETRLPLAAKRLGIGLVKSVSDCLDALVALDTPHPQDPGVLARVRRMLGLGEQATV